MNKRLLIILITILLIGGLIFFYSSRQTYAPTTPTQATTQPTTQNETAITINNFAFSPQELTIKIGTKVTWTNQDNVQHQIVNDPSGETFKSDLLSNGQSYSFTFDKAGTYMYHCSPHPSMTAKIIVQ